MGDAIKINATKLRAYLDTMHGHANARDLQSESIRKVVKEATGYGYDGKALRKVFVRERMDAEKRQRDDELLSAYEGALGGKGRALAAVAAGATLDEAAEIGGIHRATVARARAVAKQASNATPPHDPETGEISASRVAEDVEGGADCTGRSPVQTARSESEASLAGEAEAPAPIETPVERAIPEGTDQPLQAAPTAMESCGDADAERSALHPKRHVANGLAPNVMSVSPGPQDPNADGMDIPSFLRRTKEAVT